MTSETVTFAPLIVDGHDLRSPYVERYWLPVLGPSCLCLLRRIGADLVKTTGPWDQRTVTYPLAELAMAVGLPGGRQYAKMGEQAPFRRTLVRLRKFHVVGGDTPILVRTGLPDLTAAQVDRLPAHLQAELRKAA